MRNVERRLERLERLPQMQPPPTPLEEIRTQALRRVSSEDLALMRILLADAQGGSRREFTDREVEVMKAYNSDLDAEAQRMGFGSYAQAERRGGRR